MERLTKQIKDSKIILAYDACFDRNSLECDSFSGEFDLNEYDNMIKEFEKRNGKNGINGSNYELMIKGRDGIFLKVSSKGELSEIVLAENGKSIHIYGKGIAKEFLFD